MTNWAEPASTGSYVDRTADSALAAASFTWPAHLPRDDGMIEWLRREIESIESGLRKTEWDAIRLPALLIMFGRFTA